jgi:ribose transport system ATP-binding protein
MLQRPISANIGHVTVGALRGRSPWLRAADLGRAAERQMHALRIKAPSAATPVHQLSGGNQQKVVLGKWLEIAPHVVLLDDPTRGIDVGAKREIFTLMRRMAADGCVVLFRSTELPELIGMCDHILVFWRRRLAGSCAGDQLTSRSLLHAINTGELASTTSEGDPA